MPFINTLPSIHASYPTYPSCRLRFLFFLREVYREIHLIPVKDELKMRLSCVETNDNYLLWRALGLVNCKPSCVYTVRGHGRWPKSRPSASDDCVISALIKTTIHCAYYVHCSSPLLYVNSFSRPTIAYSYDRKQWKLIRMLLLRFQMNPVWSVVQQNIYDFIQVYLIDIL